MEEEEQLTVALHHPYPEVVNILLSTQQDVNNLRIGMM